MSLDLKKYPYTNNLFGQVISKMKNTSLYFLIENERDVYLESFEHVLETLSNNSNVKDLIQTYIKKQINDNQRFNSLLSEIRAGFHIIQEGFPVTYLGIQKSKTVDIKSIIDNKTAYIEVKRISEKDVEWKNIEKVLKDEKIDYDIQVGVLVRIISAKQFVKELIKYIPQNVPDEFDLFQNDYINFGLGQFRIRKRKGAEPEYHLVWCSYSVPDTKKEVLKRNDAYYSKEHYENTIREHIENSAIPQLITVTKENDLRFVFLDNIDVANYDHSYLKMFLYDGGRNQREKGWYYDYKPAKELDGIFHVLNDDYSYSRVFCFLNPLSNSFTRLNSIIKCSEKF
jgi:hypothetical protein